MRRSTVVKIVISAGAAVLLVLVIGIVVLVYGTSTACACAIPPTDSGAIETAEQYVATVADDPNTMLTEDAAAPGADRVAELAGFDSPETTWTVLVTERPDGGYGRSPGDRLVAGMSPDGEVTGLVVHTETDTQVGTVDPNVEEDEIEAVIARSGEFPIFGQLNVGMSEEVRGALTVLSLDGDRLALSTTGHGGAWAYVGEQPLQQEKYRYLRGGHRSDGTWWLGVAWFSPSDPITEED